MFVLNLTICNEFYISALYFLNGSNSIIMLLSRYSWNFKIALVILINTVFANIKSDSKVTYQGSLLSDVKKNRQI